MPHALIHFQNNTWIIHFLIHHPKIITCKMLILMLMPYALKAKYLCEVMSSTAQQFPNNKWINTIYYTYFHSHWWLNTWGVCLLFTTSIHPKHSFHSFKHSFIHSFGRKKYRKEKRNFFRITSKCLVCLFHHIERRKKKNKSSIHVDFIVDFHFGAVSFRLRWIESILPNVDNKYFRFVSQFSMYR